MPQGTLIDKQYLYARDVVTIFGRGVGAGAANLTGVKGKGVESIVRTGVGLHTITLSSQWAGFLLFGATVIDVTAPAGWDVEVVEELVATSKTVKIAIFKTGVAAELTTDETLLFSITLSNTSQKPADF
jgi:hypothetical protein